MASRLGAIGLLVVGWLVIFLGRNVPTMADPQDRGPILPFVGNAPWSDRTDVFSSVHSFFACLALVSISLVLAEIGKLIALPKGGRPAAAIVGLYQAALMVDGIRVMVPDWWSGLVFWASRRPHEIRFVSHSPIWSLVALVVSSSYLWIKIGSLRMRADVETA